jgi:nitrogen fixation/metabolism regulation signal transduction histidine kinase
MTKKPYKRSLLFHINTFQKQLILPVMLSCLFSLVCLAYLYYYSDVGRLIYNDQYYFLKMALPWILISLAFLFIVLWAYYVSNKIVGPFERVLREVDDILAGKGKKKIGTREGDGMFEELTKRINALVERLP